MKYELKLALLILIGSSTLFFACNKKQSKELDQYNTVHFVPVKTTSLRLSVKLQEGASGAISEWKSKMKT